MVRGFGQLRLSVWDWGLRAFLVCEPSDDRVSVCWLWMGTEVQGSGFRV